MHMKKVFSLILAMLLMLSCTVALADVLPSLPMDEIAVGPEPKEENYISETEYVDESITVKIYQGRYAGTDYVYAHVKIIHPSQLRTAPASIMNGGAKRASFHTSGTGRGRYIARDANAVIAMNGDYYTMKDACHVVLRQGVQIRNVANGIRDILIIDKNGDLSYMNSVYRDQYAKYYEEHKDEMYQVFSFGPALVENGVSIIDEKYTNGYIGADKCAQRAAIAQLGPLEYAMITSYGPQSKNNKGMTIYEFAAACEQIGKELSSDGFKLAFNLDGGNSATLVFRRRNDRGYLEYAKVNCPEIERTLSDIIYFATLER